MNRVSGFTLVEMITVIIIIGILSVVILPKFTGSDSFEAHPFRAQLISALRLTQQRAMQQTNPSDNYCHQIVIDDDRYGVENRVSASCGTETNLSSLDPDLSGHIVDSRYDIEFSVKNKSNPSIIGFDSMGRPLADCSGGCEILIKQTDIDETLSIKIESEGYIHAI